MKVIYVEGLSHNLFNQKSRLHYSMKILPQSFETVFLSSHNEQFRCNDYLKRQHKSDMKTADSNI